MTKTHLTSKTHWKKKFNYDYLGTYSLEEGQDLILTIRETKDEKVTGSNGSSDNCWVFYFEEVSKGMVMNRTNSKIIQKIHKSPYIEDWVGKKIQIYAKSGIRAFGEITDGLRVREFVPKDDGGKRRIKAKIRTALSSYKGDDIDQIKSSLNQAVQSKSDTEEFLLTILKQLQS
ncbi:MAG: hypothetical protein HRU41_42190 [Saprospiraceae bacterium]|nr:hypothetical protein [Saprospiraceae bacterium]